MIAVVTISCVNDYERDEHRIVPASINRNVNQRQYNKPPYQAATPPYYQYLPTQGYPQSPGSRFYTNPYGIPPSSNYNYYDSDQYYVPQNYGSVEDDGGTLTTTTPY